MVGGGSIFGPKPRDYSNQLPAQMRRNARKSALSIKAAEGQIRIVEDFTFGAPKTKEMVTVLKALELGSAKTLLLLSKPDASVVRSGRNIPGLLIAQADKASTYDFVNNQVLLIQKSALEVLQNTFKN
jgi:large subunit ribosomal protein L4